MTDPATAATEAATTDPLAALTGLADALAGGIGGATDGSVSTTLLGLLTGTDNNLAIDGNFWKGVVLGM